jgi:hypothetical protein
MTLSVAVFFKQMIGLGETVLPLADGPPQCFDRRSTERRRVQKVLNQWEASR